jgi:hypothetical protein
MEITAGTLHFCARCGHELTDAASIENGLGPECRGKANAILAKEIPQAMSPDQAFLVLTLAVEQFPVAAAARFRDVNEKILATKAFLQGEGSGQDLRSLVQGLAYLLSWKIKPGTRFALLEAIKGLGYVAYAGYLSKASSATAAQVEIRGGRLYLKAVRNIVGIRELRLIIGRTWHPESCEWSVPLAKAEALFVVVRQSWPLTDLTFIEANIRNMPKPEVRVVALGSDWVGIEAPYHPQVRTLMKELPVKDRSWDGQRWRIRSEHRGVVLSRLGQFFSIVQAA